MRLLVAEFVTGGGLADRPLPSSLTREADLMIRALVAELAADPGLALVTTRDPRLPAIAGVETLVPVGGEPFLELYRRALRGCDAAWPTAPETGGALLQLVRATVDAGVFLCGSDPAAVDLTTSKRATSRSLAGAGIAVVESFVRGEDLPPHPGRWVVKPDDGAGAEDTVVLPDAESARRRLGEAGGSGARVAQPWVDGDSLSLSLLCRAGSSRLLSVNRQRMQLEEGRLSLVGLDVNAFPDDGRFAALGRAVARAVPGLAGYVGVDLVQSADGPVVLEINPRLTTSYCALGRALGINVATAILTLLRTGTLPSPATAPGSMVTLDLEAASVR